MIIYIFEYIYIYIYIYIYMIDIREIGKYRYKSI